MCTVDHTGTARAGYLVDAPMESMASSGVLFSRMLSHHREVGLSCEQIMSLLDLNREYHDRQIAIQLEFARITEALEIKRGRINEQQLAKREELLQQHAQLFAQHERLFFEMAQRGHELLTDEQIEQAEIIYHAEKDEMLDVLSGSLHRAVGPNFQFTKAHRSNGNGSYESIKSLEPVLATAD